MAYDPNNMIAAGPPLNFAMTRFIGDIHGDFNTYEKIIAESPYPTIQVGDFGVGFKTMHDGPNAIEAPVEAMKGGDHRFIRGNHDNPAECRKTHGYIPDATMYGHWFCIGGALSIDRPNRIEGLDWWADEELSQSDLYKVIDIYETIKPDYVVSHTCPKSVALKLFPHFIKTMDYFNSRTEQAFDSLMYIHKPKIWVFGHYHQNKSVFVDGTNFECVGINQTVDIGIPSR